MQQTNSITLYGSQRTAQETLAKNAASAATGFTRCGERCWKKNGMYNKEMKYPTRYALIYICLKKAFSPVFTIFCKYFVIKPVDKYKCKQSQKHIKYFV